MLAPPFIWDDFVADNVPPAAMDRLWEEGWRHFGERFFRYSVMLEAGLIKTVIPLRIHLPEFEMSKSQRRVWRKNADLGCQFVPASISVETGAMFARHRERFTEDAPNSLLDFLSTEPGTVPCRCMELQCRLDDRLVAASYMDVGQDCASSVYGVFEPIFSGRSLGIYTMLNEITWTQQQGLKYLYPGYGTIEEGPYEYKKHFAALEGYDWNAGAWRPWCEITSL